MSFNPGETFKTVVVDITNDLLDEDSEHFYVNLLNPPTNATIGQGQGVATITDNDEPPSISINAISDITVNEANGPAIFTVTLSQASGKAVSVSYTTANGTAAAGSDYTTTSGTLTFAPGNTSQPIPVPIANDNVGEFTETFFVNLNSESNGSIGDGQGICTIIDDEPRLSISAVDNEAGEVGGNFGRLRISVDGSLSQLPFTATLHITGTASNGTDYTAMSTSYVVNALTNHIDVTPIYNIPAESLEDVIVAILMPPNAPYSVNQAESQATVTISDYVAPKQFPPAFCADGNCPPKELLNHSAHGDAIGVTCSGGPSGDSENPVRYADGVVKLQFQDLVSDGFGMPWASLGPGPMAKATPLLTSSAGAWGFPSSHLSCRRMTRQELAS